MRCARKSWLLVGCAAPLVVACSSSSPAPSGEANTAQDVAALDSPNGGLNLASKEAPAFGDPEVERLPSFDSPTMPPVTTPVNIAVTTTAPGQTAYRLLLVWGHVPPPNDTTNTDVAPTPETWTGTASMRSGSLVILKTIALGVGGTADSNGASIGFSSQTDGYVSGLLVRVLVPQGTAPTLAIGTNLASPTIDLSRLSDSPGGIVRGADGASAVAWLGFAEDGCARGFVLGRWVKDAPSLGRAFAEVTDADGDLTGYVRGVWGYAPARSGEVFFAKSIDTRGNPLGLTFGWYGDGALNGVWAAADEDDKDALRVGATGGFYSDGTDAADGRSVWLGRWSGVCPS